MYICPCLAAKLNEISLSPFAVQSTAPSACPFVFSMACRSPLTAASKEINSSSAMPYSDAIFWPDQYPAPSRPFPILKSFACLRPAFPPRLPAKGRVSFLPETGCSLRSSFIPPYFWCGSYDTPCRAFFPPTILSISARRAAVQSCGHARLRTARPGWYNNNKKRRRQAARRQARCAAPYGAPRRGEGLCG